MPLAGDTFIARLRLLLGRAGVLHVDETSTRVSSVSWWMHTISTRLLTLLVAHQRRGREAIIDIDVLPAFTGVLVRDGLATYDDLTGSTHAQCGAHLLRHLASVGEAAKHKAWTETMTRVLLDARDAATEAAHNDESTVDRHRATTIRRRYRQALNDAFALLPTGPPPRGPNKNRWRASEREAWNLATRLRAREHEILRMLADTRVPFTNNQAERDLRMTKLHDKISGTFRNHEHAQHLGLPRVRLTPEM